jgi:predicted NBD/HSP70 family sugar kinase
MNNFVASSGQLKGTIVNFLNSRPMTLAELQAATGVSLPTLRRSIQELMASGWIQPVGQSASTGGRPARLYGLNGASHIIIGAHVEIPTVNIVLAELGGKIIDRAHLSVPEGLLPDVALQAICDYARKVQAEYADRNLLGLGMAAPGYVDATTGTILYVGRAPGWQNYPMKTRLEADLALPVVMENDTDCLIRAELDDSGSTTVGNVVYLAILEGVKLSLFLNGQIYRGPFSNAGLIGRTLIPLESVDQGRGDFYDLETTTSVGGLCHQFDQRLVDLPSLDETLRDIKDMVDRNEKFREILEAAEAGHPLCVEITDQMVGDLTLAVANLLYILQPMTLIVGGQLSNLPAGLRTQLERGIREKLPPLLSNHLLIKYAKMTGRHAAALGATHWFLRRYVAMGRVFENQSLIQEGDGIG